MTSVSKLYSDMKPIKRKQLHMV